MSKKLIKSFGYKAVHIVVLIFYSIILVPVLLTYWDLEVYGTWIALYAFFNLICVIEFGHGVYVGNEFNKTVHDNEQGAKFLLGSALRANIFGCLLQILVVLILYYSKLLRYFLDKSISDFEVLIVLVILLSYRLFIGSFRGIVVKVLNPFGMIYKSFQFALMEKILEFFILVIGAVSGITLIEIAILWFSAKSVFSLIILSRLKSLAPQFYPWWKKGDLKTGISNYGKSLSYSASNFLDRLGNDGIVLVVAAMVGSTFLPLFTATRTIVNFGLKFSDFLIKPLGPEMINFYSKNKLERILDLFKMYWLATMGILTVGFAVSIFFIEDLFEFWTKGKLEFDYVLYTALVIILLLKLYGKILVQFFTGINKLWVVLFTSVIRISLFFIIALALRSYGLKAVLAGLFCSELITVTLWLPFHSFKTFALKSSEKIGFFIYLVSICALGMLFYFYEDSLLVFILAIVIIALAGYSQYQMISDNARMSIFAKFKNISLSRKK